MNPINSTLIVSLSALVLTSATAVRAEVIRLADGTILEGELAPPTEVTINTASGPRKIAFRSAPARTATAYWAKAGEAPNDPAPVAGTSVTDEEIAALANEVNLEVWGQVTAIGHFATSPRSAELAAWWSHRPSTLSKKTGPRFIRQRCVGQSEIGTCNSRPRALLLTRPTQFVKKRWLESFIKPAKR
jgi:hypothetical protein